MNRKLLTIGAFIVIFGLPVSWYLFLQAFGENNFDLPRYELWSSKCVNDSGFVVVNESAIAIHANQFQRVESTLKKANNVKFYQVDGDSCNLKNDLYLVDHQGVVRGFYNLNREEVDRFLTEIDIYLTNYKNGTSSDK